MQKLCRSIGGLALFLLLSLFCATLAAAEIKVAVAANFHGTLERLAAAYRDASGNGLVISSGASGALTTQILHGAPFDVLLSADTARPARLEADGLTLPGTRFVYAVGVPVLWSPDAQRVDPDGRVLHDGDFRFLAVAEPRNAPYGAAARQVLERLGAWETLAAARRLVKGNSIGQAHSLVASGAAELGFVALAQVQTPDGIPGSHWMPPPDLFDPIAQSAVALRRADDPAAARHFLAWLRNDETARRIIRQAGYRLE